jgi:hypothetical protein
MPTAIPEQGEIFTIWLSEEDLKSNKEFFITKRIFGVPGNDLPEFKTPRPTKAQSFVPGWTGVRCEIINDTPGPLLDVWIPFGVEFLKDEDHEASNTGRSLTLPRLDVGADNKFIVYFINPVSRPVALRLPHEASARRVSEKLRRLVNVARPDSLLGDLMVFFSRPRETKSNGPNSQK